MRPGIIWLERDRPIVASDRVRRCVLSFVRQAPRRGCSTLRDSPA